MSTIYVASSWRNATQPAVVDALRAADHEVYDFRNPPGGTGFSWRQVDPAPDAGRYRCIDCGGRRTYRGEHCGCGPGVSHFVDCGRPARPCPTCSTHAPPKGTDLVAADRYLEMLRHPRAVAGFDSDFHAMLAADAFVLVLPCGRSAHLELGWAAGAGKRTAVLLDDPVEPELMYRMVDLLACNVDEVIEWLAS